MTARRVFPAFLFVALALFTSHAEAQCVSLTTLGAPYNQNFDTLSNTAGSTTNNLTLTGWFMTEAGGGTRDNEQYAVDTGGSATGDTYSYGGAGSTDRALGGLQSGTLIPTIGACFTNNTGVTVSNLTIAYTGEQWRLGAAARTDQLDFEYSLDATSLTTGTWTAVDVLDFITPNTLAPTGLKDGNNPAFRTAISSAISPLSIANGATVWIRWLDANPGGSDDGLAVDDFSITPSVLDVAPSVLTTSPPNGATGVGLAANIDVTFSEPVNVAPGWFTINCTVSGLHAASESGGPTTFTLDPTVDFVANEICTVTIDDASVSDQDANDPPDNMAADSQWSFDTNPPPLLVVNEIDYDQAGTDAAEFIEIRNNGATPVDLDPVVIELVNGLGATPYQSIDLPNVSLAPGAYYVICANNTITPNCNLDVSPNTNLIQNGAPDAVAIRWNGVLVDTVSYEGNTGAPYTETSGTGLVDDGGDDFAGISRFPDGGDTGVNNVDLSERCITPGAANTASTAPCSPPAILGLSIDDVAAAEGQAGTRTFTFTVRLDQPAPPGGVTFDIATADGTAEDGNPGGEDNDYVPQSLTGQTIPEGDDEYTFEVTVNSDLTVEPDETFFVNVTNVTGTTVGDPQAVGTIQNDDFAAITPIHDIQGPGTSSPIVGSSVTIHGIVTGAKSNGFFVQEEEADYDADPATSEGIFVFTSSAPPPAAQMGNLVYVTGTVAEFVPSGDPQQPPLTELTSATTVLDATGIALPAPVPLSATFPDPAGPHDQLERVEGMRVSAASITVTGPSDGSFNESAGTGTSNGRFHGVVTGVARPFRESGIQAPDVPSSGTIPPIPRWDFNPERLRIESATLNAQPILTVKSSDVVGPVIGPLDYAFRGYAIYPDGTSAITVTPGSLPTTVTPAASNEITVASFNMQRLFDDVDDPNGDPVPTTTAYDDRLAKASIAIRAHMLSPDIIGVQEVEKIEVLQDLAAKILADGGPDYDAYLVEGNDVGGIDVGFLVKTDLVTGGVPRVSVTSVTQEGAATQWLDPSDNAMHTLNDRPPLVLEGTVNFTSTVGFPIVVIVNHLRSLIGIDSEAPDGLTTEGDRVRQKRQAQAEFLANYVQGRLTSNPAEHIVVTGDFNAFEVNDGYTDVMNVIAGTPPPDNETVVPGDGIDLVNPDLVNLVSTPPAAERYSYLHEGNAQNIDHVLVSAALVSETTARRIEHPRIGADHPETERNDNSTALRLSDHDPVVAYFSVLSADFAVDVQHPTGYATAGADTDYTVVVTNNGPDAADGSFSFPLPAGTTIAALVAATGWDCPFTIATTTLVCTTTTPLAVADPANFTISVSVPGATPGNTVLSTTGTVTSGAADLNAANDQDSQDVVVLSPSQYRAEKTVGGTFTTGSNVTYTITIFNDKPFAQGDNPGDELTDVLPASLTLVSANATGGTAVANIGTNTVTWNGSIASGGTVTITIVATINASAAGTVSNQAALADDFDDDGTNERNTLSDDPSAGGSADPTNFTAVQSNDVTATKSVSGSFVQGTNVTYTVVMTNNMSIAQPDNFQHEFTDILPAGLTFVSAGATSGTTGFCCGDTFFWNGSIPAGGTVTITIVATIDPAATGVISNQGQTIFDSDNDASNDDSHLTDDPSTPAPDDATSFTVIPSGEVVATKSVSGSFEQGSSVTYTIVVTNGMGITQLDNPGDELTDVLPASLTLVNANATSGTAAANVGTNTVTWNGALAPGASATITVEAELADDATGTVANQATLAFDTDGNGTNESAGVSDDPSTGTPADATTFTVIVHDSDGDGVDDVIEQAAPNGGDGNGDGIPDHTQSTVASIPAATGSGYLTLQSSCTLQEVYVTTASAMPSPDPGFQYPHGMIAFRAPCPSATFSLFVYGSGAVSAYRKFGPLPPGGPQQWYGIPATFGTATVGSLHPHRIGFSLTDGGTGDDTPVDGVIVDQGGPSGPTNIPTLDELALLALAAMLAMVALLVMKR